MKSHSTGHHKNRAALSYSKILTYLVRTRPDTFDPDKLEVQPDTGDKVAQAVLEIAQPVIDTVEDLDSVKSILGVTIELWNLLALPEPERKDFLVDLVNDMDLESRTLEFREGIWKDIDTLIDRREKLFGDDRRIIILFKLYLEADEIRFRVEGLGLPPEI